MELPYPRIKLCRAGKTDLSIFILRLLTSGMSLAESPSFYLISFCHRISQKKKTIALSWPQIQPGGRRGGGTQDLKWQGWSNGGKNQNPKNSLGLPEIPEPRFHPSKSHAEFPTIKIYSRNYAAGIRGNYHESSDCFECLPKSLLKSSYLKYLPKFSKPKIFRNRKFQPPPKKPSIIPVTWNLEYPP